MSKKLRAPVGTDECNYGEQRFPVDTDGTVNVPDEAVASLVHDAGFIEIDITPSPAPVGFVKVASTAGAVSVSWGGATYDACADGAFLVPAIAVADIAAHGFAPVEG